MSDLTRAEALAKWVQQNFLSFNESDLARRIAAYGQECRHEALEAAARIADAEARGTQKRGTDACSMVKIRTLNEIACALRAPGQEGID